MVHLKKQKRNSQERENRGNEQQKVEKRLVLAMMGIDFERSKGPIARL